MGGVGGDVMQAGDKAEGCQVRLGLRFNVINVSGVLDCLLIRTALIRHTSTMKFTPARNALNETKCRKNGDGCAPPSWVPAFKGCGNFCIAVRHEVVRSLTYCDR